MYSSLSAIALTGRPDIQQFMGVMTNDDRQRGFFVSFDYSQEAHDEVAKFHKNTACSSS